MNSNPNPKPYEELKEELLKIISVDQPTWFLAGEAGREKIWMNKEKKKEK